HEWHLGVALIVGAMIGIVLDAWDVSPFAGVIGAAGVWLVLKDWRDIVPSMRDTAAWRFGLHRRTAPLRAIRRAEGLPPAAGAVAFAVGLVNLASAMTPDIAWRHHLLLHLEPMKIVPVFHTLAVPLSAALIGIAFSLRGRRRRAWQLALILLV